MRARRLLLTTLVGVLAAAAPASAETIYGLTDSGRLVSFGATTPAAVSTPIAITGLASGETITGIDVRPATLQLYALGSTGRLYRVNVVTGAATALAGSSGVTVAGDGDIDFNPTVDALRVVSDAEQNARVNPDTGALTATDTSLPAGTVTGAAYTKNAPASASYPAAPATTLLDVDTASDTLRTQAPANAGTLADVGPLGVDLDGDVGFDVSTVSKAVDGTPGADTAYLAGRKGTGPERLFTVDTATGAATEVGPIGGTDMVTDIAVAAPVPQLAVLTTAPITSAQSIVTVRADLPGTAGAPVTVTGLQSGETLEGIDRRPSGGAVYGYGSTGRLYTLDLATGTATQVGTGAFTFAGTSFGFDFNPVADRIRVVSDTAANGRLDPDDGTLTADTDLTYAAGGPAGTPHVTAAAYTNAFATAAATTLFDLDTANDIVAIQGAGTPPVPNGGVLTQQGPIGVANLSDGSGFDIARRFNQQFAALSTDSGTVIPVPTGAPMLYALNGSGDTTTTPAGAAVGGSALVGAIGTLTLGTVVSGLTIVNDDVLPAPPVPPSPTGPTGPTGTAGPMGTATAVPSASPTAVPTYAVPKPTRLLPGLTAKVRPKRDRRKPFRFRVTGTLKRPSGVGRAAGCTGKVRVLATRGRKTVAHAAVKVRARCAYTAKVKLNRKARKRGKATFVISFRGNQRLLKRTVVRSARYGRR